MVMSKMAPVNRRKIQGEATRTHDKIKPNKKTPIVNVEELPPVPQNWGK